MAVLRMISPQPNFGKGFLKKEKADDASAGFLFYRKVLSKNLPPIFPGCLPSQFASSFFDLMNPRKFSKNSTKS